MLQCNDQILEKVAGMHQAAFFCFRAGRGGAEEIFFGVGQGGAGAKSSGWGKAGQQLNSGHFWGGVGRGGACIPEK